MYDTDEGIDSHALPRRPGSSRYRILPSIGQTSCTEIKLEESHLYTPLDGQKGIGESSVDAKDEVSTTVYQSRMQKDVKLAVKGSSDVKQKSPVNRNAKETQPSEQRLLAVEQQVALAVKLPSGQRIEHHFQPTEKLIDVLHYVETIAQQDFTNCEFVSADHRIVLTDLNLTIASSGVLSRSVLYLQLPDEI